MQDNNGGRNNGGDDVALDMDADDEEDMADNGSEAPLDEVDRDGIPAEPLKTLLVGGRHLLFILENICNSRETTRTSLRDSLGDYD